MSELSAASDPGSGSGGSADDGTAKPSVISDAPSNQPTIVLVRRILGPPSRGKPYQPGFPLGEPLRPNFVPGSIPVCHGRLRLFHGTTAPPFAPSDPIGDPSTSGG